MSCYTSQHKELRYAVISDIRAYVLKNGVTTISNTLTSFDVRIEGEYLLIDDASANVTSTSELCLIADLFNAMS